MTHSRGRRSSAATVVIVLSRMPLASGFIPAPVVTVVLFVGSRFSVVGSGTIGVRDRWRVSTLLGVNGRPLWSLFMRWSLLVCGLVVRYRRSCRHQQHRH
jgi:hypothetical protein